MSVVIQEKDPERHRGLCADTQDLAFILLKAKSSQEREELKEARKGFPRSFGGDGCCCTSHLASVTTTLLFFLSTWLCGPLLWRTGD